MLSERKYERGYQITPFTQRAAASTVNAFLYHTLIHRCHTLLGIATYTIPSFFFITVTT